MSVSPTECSLHHSAGTINRLFVPMVSPDRATSCAFQQYNVYWITRNSHWDMINWIQTSHCFVPNPTRHEYEHSWLNLRYILYILSCTHMYPATLTDPLRRFRVELVPGKKCSKKLQYKFYRQLNVDQGVPYDVKTRSTLDSFFAIKELKISKINLIS